MRRGQKFLTVIVLIVLLSLWFMERPRLAAAYGQVQAARRPATPAPATPNVPRAPARPTRAPGGGGGRPAGAL